MTGARIIDLTLARQTRVQLLPTRVTVGIDCSALLRDLETQMDHFASSISGIRDGLAILSETCGRLSGECDQTVAFCDQCLKACELTDLDALEQAREKLMATWRERNLNGMSIELPTSM